MDKWFKLCDSWRMQKGLSWNPKKNWNLFTTELKRILDIDKIDWSKLDYKKTKFELIGYDLDDCFEIKLIEV